MIKIESLINLVIDLLKKEGINIIESKKLNVPSGQGKTIICIKIKNESDFILKIVDVTPNVMKEDQVTENTKDYDINAEIMYNSVRIINELEMSKKCSNLPQLRKIGNDYFRYIIHDNNAYMYYIEQKIEGTMLKYKENYSFIEVISFIEQLLNNIQIMSSNSYVHRDIKPSNIIEKYGIYHLIDGGICKNTENGLDITMTGSTIGTSRYLAPEQKKVSSNTKWTFQTDLYPVGIIATEMFAPKTRHISNDDIRDLQIVSKKWLENDNSDKSILLFKRIIVNLLNEVKALRFNSIHEAINELNKVKEEVIK